MSDDNSKNIEDDYNTSRDTYKELIEGGKLSLESMIELAKESEHPRAYEVLSGMIKNIADVTDKLMELNKKHKDVIKNDNLPVPTGGESNTTTTNVFLGSTTELQRLLSKHDEKVIESDPDEQ
tara:strand:- start:728 stop:1096 length:369 start_codon:yes stop_codon:yes gene_type:complete